MLRSNIKLTIRNLVKRKWYTLINVLGLATGMAACLVILEYVNLELTYDNFHTYKSQVYRTLITSFQNGENRGTYPSSGYAQGPSLKQDYAEVELFCRLHPQYGGAVVTAGEGANVKQFFEEDMYYVDSTFFELFTYPLVQGDINTALNQPKSILLTETMAKKYFDDDKVIGKTMVLDGGWDEGEYLVTGILADLPQNTHLKFDFIMSIADMLSHEQYQEEDGWYWSNFFTYVKLNINTDVKAFEQKLPEFVLKYEGDDLAKSNSSYVMNLQPIEQIHLTPGLEVEIAATRSSTSVYAFGIIALFILIIAWVNYINLATARAMERAREVGIKKVIGSSKLQLVSQFLMEAGFLNIVSMILAIVLAALAMPYLSQIIGKTLVLSSLSNINFWLVVLTILILGSLLSGLYPAFVLASFKPSTVLKASTGKGGRTQLNLRRALVIFQFAASLSLIAGTLTVYKQISFMRNQDLGLNLDQVVVVKGPNVLPDGIRFSNTFSSFKNEVANIPGVISMSSSSSIPGGDFSWSTPVRRSGEEESSDKSGNATWVDDQFFTTYDIAIVSGKIWNLSLEADRDKVIINETALSTFGLGGINQALGVQIILGSDTVEIIGVTEEYSWASLKKENVPILLLPSRGENSYFSLKLHQESINSTLAAFEEEYKSIFPGNPFNYFFIDDYFNEQYHADQQFGTLFSIFAVLAIFVACLGLSGLASFTAIQRTKEIGVRKVLGASSKSIVILLSRNFVVMVLISSLLVMPLLVWGMQEWLNGYATRISLSWDLFVLPLFLLVLITVATVSLQTLRSARANPANSLRIE